jgi:hypothetical protein
MLLQLFCRKKPRPLEKTYNFLFLIRSLLLMSPTACDRVRTVLTAGGSNSNGADRFFAAAAAAAAGFNPPLLSLSLSCVLSPSLLLSWTPSPTVESAVLFASFHGCNLGMPAILFSGLYNLYDCGNLM